jgi:DNA invertase Pin-like site-specific DNA recombinase
METKITKIDALPKLEKKLRVAAYARVSSEKDAMLQSLSNQVSYYNNLIRSTEGWSFVGVYADEALSGTKDTRDEFQRLIKDAVEGEIDLILVKSISRFARNTVTMLETVRKLKTIGVDVYFEEQNLHSLSGEGEMVLTFLASFAQEEARSVSENQKEFSGVLQNLMAIELLIKSM